MEFAGKVAIVTGGSSGIGRSVAEILARRGAKVLIDYHSNRAGAERVIEGIASAGGAASLYCGDISRPGDITGMFDICAERYGNPDILVANSAHMGSIPMMDVTERDYYTYFDVNVKGTFFCIQEAGRRMNDSGRIIVVSSSSVRNPVDDMILYTASKSALHAMVEIAARVLAPRGITVNSVLPGVTATEKALNDLPPEFIETVKKATPFGRVGRPEDVASAIVMLAGPDSGWVSGQHIMANGASTF